jgi:hypothetical protein
MEGLVSTAGSAGVSAPGLDRRKLVLKPLSARRNKVRFPEDAVDPASRPRDLPEASRTIVAETADRVKAARASGRPVMCAFGAHAIKNGLGPVLIRLMRDGWITHLATNGAGIIHDWELAYQGSTSEDVRENISRGEFGTWEDTGRFINLALLAGARTGLGYGQSVGAFIANQGLELPSAEELADEIPRLLSKEPGRAAAAADLLSAVKEFGLPAGRMEVPHPWAASSVQAAAWSAGVPFTGHPMIGHDIIYAHPLNSGAAVGRTALTDFLVYADGVSRLEGGVYLSIGSAVMSPMIFEKSLSMARNIALQEGRTIETFYILVVDLAESAWDWTRDGEPPVTDPAYYLRYCKTFSRMGGTMRYMQADNRDFFLAFAHALQLS